MSVIRSNMLVRRPMGLVATPTRMSSAGKKARKRLYATACAIMLVRGKTRPNTPKARFARAAEAIIARHYTYAERWQPETLASGIGSSRCQLKSSVARGQRLLLKVKIGLDNQYLL